MPKVPPEGPQASEPKAQLHANNTAAVRPTEAQRRYLAQGLRQAGGKLPLFDGDGQEIPRRTVEACITHGWAEPWFPNPLKVDWIVCKLTPEGYRALGIEPASTAAEPES